MEPSDNDVANQAINFVQRRSEGRQAVLRMVNFSHMHLRTMPSEGASASGRWPSEYHDAMIDHDKKSAGAQGAERHRHHRQHLRHVRTDNGPHMNSWPDATMTPFRSEKNTNWEGAYRVPAMVRWPGQIKPVRVQRDGRPPRLAADSAGHRR